MIAVYRNIKHQLTAGRDKKIQSTFTRTRRPGKTQARGNLANLVVQLKLVG